MNISKTAVLGAVAVLVGQPIAAQPSEDYEHAIGLRDDWVWAESSRGGQINVFLRGIS
jgi:hypothetical protein